MDVLFLVYYIGLFVSVTKSCSQMRAFLRDDDFLDKKQTKGKLMTKSRILNGGDCGLECQANDKCVSFFHNSITKECQLNSVIYLSVIGSQLISGTQYYRQQLACPSTPPVVANSTHTFDDENIQTSEGSRLQYECESGYTQIGEVKCQKNGQWSTMSCVKDCPSTPPVVANSTHSFDDANIQTSLGSQLQYECESGYTQIGEVKCQENGQWSDMSCVKDCSSTPPVIAHSTHTFDDANIETSQGSQLQYECESGYTQIGEVKCQTNGQWSAMSCVRATLCYDDGSTFVKDDTFVDIKLSAGRIDTITGIARYTKCETICKRYDDCVSYFYNSQTRVCELNSISYRSTEGKEESTGTVYYRNLSVCPRPPMLNAYIVSVDNGTYIDGDELEFNCNESYIAENMNNKITCQSDGTWTSMRCNLIQSCSQVHECNSTYSDGHYWIYPRNFGGERVKIYCHDISGSPEEYVTLPVENVALYPDASNEYCGASESSCRNDQAGKTRFHKIRVNIMNMEVSLAVRTFATQDFGHPCNYGMAGDCYTKHRNNVRATCGPKGTINIDLTGTGLKVDPTLTFKLANDGTWGDITRNEDNTKIDILCGGSCGGCIPNGPFLLHLYPPEEPEESSAITPSCAYP